MITPTELANAAGISIPYASQLLMGRAGLEQGRSPSLATALRIFDRTGERFGALVGATGEDIVSYRRLQDAA